MVSAVMEFALVDLVFASTAVKSVEAASVAPEVAALMAVKVIVVCWQLCGSCFVKCSEY